MGGHRRPILSIYTELHTIFPDQLMAQFQRVVTIIESEVMSKFQRLLHDTMPKVNNKVLCTENFTERGSILCYHKKKKKWREHKETCGGDGYIYYLDGDGNKNVYICPN